MHDVIYVIRERERGLERVTVLAEGVGARRFGGRYRKGAGQSQVGGMNLSEGSWEN